MLENWKTLARADILVALLGEVRQDELAWVYGGGVATMPPNRVSVAFVFRFLLMRVVTLSIFVCLVGSPHLAGHPDGEGERALPYSR
jgi:hypothetical protein